MLKIVNVMHNCCIIPSTEFPSSTAGDEEDGDEDQCSYQEDGEDHQQEHIAILLLLGLEWDLLRCTEEGKDKIRSDKLLIEPQYKSDV